MAVFALVALACFSAGAEAGAGHHRLPAGRWIDIELEGSNGYSVHISVDPRQHLSLQVAKEEFSAEYTTRDSLVDAGRIKAKLLGLGSVSVRFHPRGPVLHPSALSCGSRHPTVQPGVVRGTIEFTGEGGYTQVKVHEAQADIEEGTSWNCRTDEEFAPYAHDSEWVSKFSASLIGTYFIARKYRPGVLEGGQVLFFAERGEAFETTSGHVPLTIRRRIRLPAPASTYQDVHPEHIVISPPPPFAGTGTFFRTPESVFGWRGDLTVQFPGTDPLPLTGSEFEPEYCLREAGCIRQQVRTPRDGP